jgi:hypothetical protein
VDCLFYYDATSSPRLCLGAPFSCILTYHVSNVPSRILLLNPSSASSPRRWSNTRIMMVSSRKKLWRCLLSARILPNMRADPQALWPSSVWRGQTNRHLLTSCTWRTCDEQKWCWTNSSSCNCCKGPSTLPLVLLQLLMYANWLSTKLRSMMDIAFFICLWYSYNTL